MSSRPVLRRESPWGLPEANRKSTSNLNNALLQLLMIIKGLFRRYERWNPVHPTAGAFWGMGIGLGCGVGWGPGFGPEVVGYVGAGCGLGFSVGFTVAGVGIGLPTNTLFRIPYNVFAISSGSLGSAISASVPAGVNWKSITPHVSFLTKEAHKSFSSFKANINHAPPLELNEMKKVLNDHAQSAILCMETFGNQHLPFGKGGAHK